MEEHKTYCRICPVLCGLVVTVDAGRVVSVRGDREHPITRGYCCPKGRALGAFHHHPQRLDEPTVRRRGTSESRRVTWDATLDDIAETIRAAVDIDGPDAVGFYAGTWSWFDSLGRRTLDRLFDRIGSRSRYSALTVDAVVRSYVSERMSGSASLIPQLDPDANTLTLLVGTNPVVSHGHSSAIVDPISRLRASAAQGGLWVIDPVVTETARLATRHLAPRPGTDVALLAFLVRELLVDGADRAYLRNHTDGVSELTSAVAPFTREVAAAHTGLGEDDLTDLLAAVRRSGHITALSGTGVTMSPTGILTEWLLWTLHTVTGSWEKPGGPWCNPGYQTRLDLRPPVAGSNRASGPSGPRSRPDLVGRFGERPCAALNDEIESGNVRVLVVLGGNPATSLPDAARFAAATRRLDALVVADVVESDTVRLATHVLPVAGQLERTDVTTLVELFSPVVAAQHTPPVLPAPGLRRATWRVFADLAARLGHNVLPDGIDHEASSDADLVSASRRNPFTAESLRRASVLLSDDPRPRGWIHDTVLEGRRWNLAPPELVSRLAALDDPPPLVFTPRRASRRMNSALRDVHAPGGKLDPTHVWVHPADAAVAGISTAAFVTVRSDVGSIVAPLLVTDRVRRGTVSVPHGLPAEQNVSRLTTGAEGTIEPLTGMIAQSGVPVTLSAAD